MFPSIQTYVDIKQTTVIQQSYSALLLPVHLSRPVASSTFRVAYDPSHGFSFSLYDSFLFFSTICLRYRDIIFDYDIDQLKIHGCTPHISLYVELTCCTWLLPQTNGSKIRRPIPLQYGMIFNLVSSDSVKKDLSTILYDNCILRDVMFIHLTTCRRNVLAVPHVQISSESIYFILKVIAV